MENIFVVHSRKLQFVSWKTESGKVIKTRAEFFKDLLPGDIIELSFVLRSTSTCKNYMTVKAWRGGQFVGERTDSFNMISNGMYYFNLKEID